MVMVRIKGKLDATFVQSFGKNDYDNHSHENCDASLNISIVTSQLVDFVKSVIGSNFICAKYVETKKLAQTRIHTFV